MNGTSVIVDRVDICAACLPAATWCPCTLLHPNLRWRLGTIRQYRFFSSDHCSRGQMLLVVASMLVSREKVVTMASWSLLAGDSFINKGEGLLLRAPPCNAILLIVGSMIDYTVLLLQASQLVVIIIVIVMTCPWQWAMPSVLILTHSASILAASGDGQRQVC